MFMSDPAVNINPDVARKVDMVRNAIWVAQRLGFARPKVAVLAAIEKINVKDMPATADAAVIAKMGETGQFADADIAGPYALDIAVSHEGGRVQAHHRAGGRLRRHPALPRHQLGQHPLQVAGLFRRPGDRQRDDRRENAAGDDLPFRQLPDEALHDGADRRVGGRRPAMSRTMTASRAQAKKRDLVIVVNPGSTSTKLAVYRGEECLAEETINHPKEELAQFARVADQYEFRRDAVLRFLADRGVELDALHGGGRPRRADQADPRRRLPRQRPDAPRPAERPAGASTRRISAPRWPRKSPEQCGAPAFIVDPVVVDEFWPLARYAGHPAFERKSRFHALSQRAAARRAARELGVSYEKVNFIVVHMGGGISIGAHRKGRVVDVNDALDGDGPFSPERSGSLPTGPLASLCFSGKHTHDGSVEDARRARRDVRLSGHQRLPRGRRADPPRRRQGPRSLRGDGLPDRQVGGGVGGGPFGPGQGGGDYRRHGPIAAAGPADPQVRRLCRPVPGLPGNGGDGRPGQLRRRPRWPGKSRSRSIVKCLESKLPRNCARRASFASRSARRTASSRADTLNRYGVYPMRMRDDAECTGCTLCATMCPDTAIEVYRTVVEKPRPNRGHHAATAPHTRDATR